MIAGPAASHLGASGALQDPAWLCVTVTELPISADVGQVIAAEFVVDSLVLDVKDQVAAAAELDVLEHQVPPPYLVVAILH